MAFRFLALTSLFFLSYGVLGYNLYDHQVLKRDYYFEKAEARNDFKKELELRRGQIFFTDRDGQSSAAAQNRDYPVVFASPNEIKDAASVAKLLSPIVGKDEEKLIVAFQNKGSFFYPLIDKASEEQMKAVESLELVGIHVNDKQYRFYPFNNLASHVLGFVGLNESNNVPTGLYGIERLKNDSLAEGEDMNLTIDANLQGEAEQVLKDLIREFNAVGGTVIIEEPETGKILALASAPDFNPNSYSEYPVKNFLNPAVAGIYEPGSVFKVITMASGIDLGVITPETTYVDRGKVTLNGKTIENWDKKAYGEITMTNVLERSVNTGAVFAETQIGHKAFLEYIKKFGFGEVSGIDLPDEAIGSLRSLERKEVRDIDFATAAFGQGPAVTPIQLINAYSVIASGGVLMRPYINASEEPEVIRRVISEEAAREVTEMMESAVNKAEVAAIKGYRVAGKTGTAQIPDFEKGGYSDELIHNFVGFAPASDPKFVILIKIDKPDSPLAGLTVVPAFRKLAEFTLNYYHIAPDGVE
ncbi:MAG: penicillin-binding protein 2 [Candidatus Jorgensenbacteria bacterium]